MNLSYYKEDDILVIKNSKEPYDHAEMMGDLVVHFTKDEKPVRIEILNASNFLNRTAKILPKNLRRRHLIPA